MEHRLHATARVGIVAALHLLLARFAYDWWRLGPHYVGHSYLPRHDFLLEGAASAVCLVLVFPVLWRGSRGQRGVAAALSLLPAFLFVMAAYYVIRINIFARG
jgi:hypothetical protein